MNSTARTYVALAIVAGLILGGAIAVATTGGNESGGGPVELDVRQDAVAEDQGVQLRLTRAAFSGTATFLEATAEFTGEGADNPVVAVSILPSALAPGSLKPSSGSNAIRLAEGRPTRIRFEPTSPGESPVLAFNEVALQREDGSREALSGTWSLPVKVPDDIRARVQVEHLQGSALADSGIRVTVEGAVRSATETLVTVRVDSTDPVTQLAEPVLFEKGERFTGGLIAEQEGGRLLTYSFPPTAFGSATEVTFGPFVQAGAEASGSVRLDIGAVLARHGLRGANGEFASLSAADVVGSSGAPVAVNRMEFSDLYKSTQHPGKHNTVKFTISGAYHVPTSWLFTVTGARGEPLDIAHGGYGYSKDASGVISSPRTEVAVLYDSLSDLDGTVTITLKGAPEEIIRGDWTIRLSPAP